MSTLQIEQSKLEMFHEPKMNIEDYLTQWIGLGENLQESPIFNGKITLVSGVDFPQQTNPLFNCTI